jgi:hypothetical protein
MKIKSENEVKKSPESKRARLSCRYSNSLGDSIKTFCCECDKAVTISGLEEHTQSHHKMTIKEYKQLYGNPRTQIIHIVYHQCGLCRDDLLLDHNVLEKHVKRCHQVEFKEYCNKFLPSVEENKTVIIRCDQCSKTFKRNIQLRAHKKRHVAAKTDEEFHGFKSTESSKRKQILDGHIKCMDIAIHREKQAFHQFLKLVY